MLLTVCYRIWEMALWMRILLGVQYSDLASQYPLIIGG